MRFCGAFLALLAILVQAALPLADANWHAVERAGPSGPTSPQRGVADVAVVTVDPTQSPSHPPTAGHACQLCIAMQGFSGVLATPTIQLAEPIRFSTIDLPSVDQAGATTPRGRPHQPRAPPIQA